MRVAVPRDVLAALRAHADAAAPDEACGALVGRFTDHDTTPSAEGVGVVGRFTDRDTTASAEGVGVVGRFTDRDTTASAEGVGVVGRFLGEGAPLTRDREVVRAVPMRNAHPRPRGAYLLDPGELVAVAAEAEAAGLDVVGFYHSHPRGPPGPSAEDVARATWAGATYLVLWSEPEPGCGAWRWDEAGRRFVDEAIDPD